VQAVRIRLKGHVNRDWSDWLDMATVEFISEGDTVLTGTVNDQSALHGLINRISNLGIPLVTVSCDDANPEGKGLEEEAPLRHPSAHGDPDVGEW
jgi:hypothetical protein